MSISHHDTTRSYERKWLRLCLIGVPLIAVTCFAAYLPQTGERADKSDSEKPRPADIRTAHEAIQAGRSAEAKALKAGDTSSALLDRARADFPTFIKALNGQRPDEFRLVVLALLTEDLSRANEILPFLTASERVDALSRITALLIERNPDEFFEQVRKIKGAGKLDLYSNSLSHFLKRGDYETLRRVHLEMPFSSARESGIEMLAPTLARNNEALAFQWLNELADDGERTRAIEAIARSQSEKLVRGC